MRPFINYRECTLSNISICGSGSLGRFTSTHPRKNLYPGRRLKEIGSREYFKLPSKHQGVAAFAGQHIISAIISASPGPMTIMMQI